MRNPTRAEKFKQLIRVLESVPDEKFNMYGWGERDGAREEVVCGTTGCAAGWAGSDAWFNAHGLKLCKLGEAGVLPEYGLNTRLPALESFFKLTHGAARDIFMSYRDYTTPEHVITKIKALKLHLEPGEE